MIPAGKKRYGKIRSRSHPEIEYHKPATWKRPLVSGGGDDKRRKHDHWLVTLVYPDGEKFCRVYKDRDKALAFADRQKKSPVVKLANVTQIG
jgi:hypothetical protein